MSLHVHCRGIVNTSQIKLGVLSVSYAYFVIWMEHKAGHSDSEALRSLRTNLN